MLLKEHQFRLSPEAEATLFRVEELVVGIAGSPDRFRLKLPASGILCGKETGPRTSKRTSPSASKISET
jgi:hypothetical protein